MSDTLEERPRPSSKTDLFVSFTLLALQGFGGVLSVVQREMVEKKKWLTPEEFVEDWAVAQILPGPNVINLSLMIGGRHFGLMGALAALGGIMCVPSLLVLTIAILFAGVEHNAAAQGVLRGMGAVCAGLIVATGLKMIPALKSNPMGRWSCVALAVLGFITVGLLRLPLAWVLLTLGPIAGVWAGMHMRQGEST
jgi:chromate transporter